MMTLLLVAEQGTLKPFLEVEIILNTGEIVTRRLPASRLIQITFEEGEAKVA